MLKKGQVVKVVGTNTHFDNTVCCVLSGPAMARNNFDVVMSVYEVDIDPGVDADRGAFIGFPEPFLEPIDDDYDGNETTDWEECPWQPEKVTV